MGMFLSLNIRSIRLNQMQFPALPFGQVHRLVTSIRADIYGYLSRLSK